MINEHVLWCVLNFRLLLTTDSVEIQQTIMNIVKQIVKAAQEDLTMKKSNIVKGK